MLLKIKEFSEFCHVSIRALQLYDRMELFTPAQTDESNGYRYYDTEQMQELITILSYKSVGFSLKEIVEIKKNMASKDYLLQCLTDKKKENQKQINVLEYNNETIDSMITAISHAPIKQSENEKALELSKISCLDNQKLEENFSKIIWL